MQFRPQGNRIQVLAYRGYDKEKRRATVKLLGSFDRLSLNVSDDLLSKLTDDERTELQSHINSIRQSRDRLNQQYSLIHVDSHINFASDSLISGDYDSHVSDEYATRVYEAIDKLTKALRKAGFKRPLRRTNNNQTVG